mmetsp:Transcript_18107/g.59494  ORF Transcript_18107/g.59494 Transcript_18107/m.59494 type:complete len:90 (-) Transcript_18107:181-450(-)
MVQEDVSGSAEKVVPSVRAVSARGDQEVNLKSFELVSTIVASKGFKSRWHLPSSNLVSFSDQATPIFKTKLEEAASPGFAPAEHNRDGS